jgi:starch synthase
MKLLLAHPGTQHSPHLAQALHQRDALLAYCTTLALGEGSRLASLLPMHWANRRRISLPASLIHIQPALEIFERMMSGGASSREMLIRRNKVFQRLISDRLISSADAVIGFDTSSVVLAQRSKKLSRPFYLELTTPHPLEKQAIMQMLSERYPAWVSSSDVIGKIVENDEVREAFHISAPSQFVKHSYVKHGTPASKVSINPYGVYPGQFPIRHAQRGKKIRFLFMGSITANKGVPLLLEAWQEVNVDKAELVLAGYGSIPPGVPIPKGLIVAGRIEKSERVGLMHSCDVFVCPSFYVGIALVQIEGMCCGLPLIGTTASGAEGIITPGSEGFIVPSGSATALAEKMNFFVNYPENIETMGKQAHSTASTLTWESYTDRMLNMIRMHSNVAG